MTHFKLRRQTDEGRMGFGGVAFISMRQIHVQMYEWKTEPLA